MYQPGKFGLKRVPMDPFRPKLCTFLFIHCRSRAKITQNGSKWAQKRSKGVKMWSKRGQPGSKCAQLDSKWLTRENRLQRGPEGSHATQRGQNGLKMASNTPKWLFPGPICISTHRGRSTRYSKMGGGGTGTPQRRVLRLGSRFLARGPILTGFDPF